MKHINYLFVLVFLNFQISFAQKEMSKQMNEILQNQYNNTQKIEQLQKLLHQYKNTSNTPETGIVHIELAKILVENEENDKAINSLKIAIRILKKYKKTHLFELNKSRNDLALIYFYDERMNEQYQLYKEIINDKANDEFTFNAINNSATIESKRGDHFFALNKLNLLLTKKLSMDEEIRVRMNIIKIYAIMTESYSNDKFKKHIQIIQIHQKKVEKSFKNTSLKETLLYGFYNNLANIYASIEENDTALQFYLKSKNYYSKQNETFKELHVTNNIGYLLANQKKTKQAIECFQTIIKRSDDRNQIATAYDNLAYFLDAKPSKKIPYFQKALQIILDNHDATFTLPSIDLIRESGFQQEILVFLVDLSDNYVKAYKETNDKAYLLNAKKSLYLIDELVSLIRYESNTEQSKLFWIEKGVNTYMLATEVCYLLNKPAEAFYFIEKNKALLLQENIKNFQAKIEFQIPKELLEKEYKLHYELIALEKLFNKNPNNSSLKLRLSTKNKEFQTFKNLIERKYPNYSKLKENIDIITIEKAISNLTKDECFVTYIVNDTDGYGIFCNSKEKIFFKIDNVISLQMKLKTLKNYMSKNVLDKNKTIAFKSLGNSVFKSLFPFPNAVEKIKGKKIIIIPDDSLLNLPFEALPINNAKLLSARYLINYSEVSYLQSFSVFEKIKQQKSKPSKKLLAIAPYQFEDKNLQELMRSKEAITDLKKYNGATIFVEEKATKENFYQNCQDYEILHLNTHAGIDSITESPWISFRNSKLTLDELYGINNHSELVILDACKTNDGTIASGEGILSLTRGFFNNGAKSVVASLWNVNEKAGNEIIASFYSELEDGKSKSKAIQIAKKKYLKEHKNTEILPYYWASFTLTGSTEPVALSESYFQGISLVIILTLLSLSLSLLLFFIYKRRKHFISK